MPIKNGEYVPGPSGIKRYTKFKNRHKKKAQHEQNVRERAAKNAERKIRRR